jgi:hypothetical protein
MTDDEALAILRAVDGFGGWVDWDSENDRPDWIHWGDAKATLKLDGDFTVDELLALIHFAQYADKR